jgi:hypothetical protein
MDDILTGHCNHIQTSISGGPPDHSPTGTQYCQDSGHPIEHIDNNFHSPLPNSHIYHNLSNQDNPDHLHHGGDIEIFLNPHAGIVYPSHFFSFDDRSITIGDPFSDMNQWHRQALPDSCAIVCQEYILHSFFPEEHFDELELVKLAYHDGYYFPGGGTLPIDVGRILEHFKIEVVRSYDNTVADIIKHLNNNHKIIVGVDSNEIWANSELEQIKDLIFLPEANHAVEVIGYDPIRQVFILNDPGNPEGKGFEVSQTDFEAAWQDSNNFMMVTKCAPPPHDITRGQGQHVTTV